MKSRSLSRRLHLLTYQMPDELLAIASAGEFDEFDLNEFFAATGTGKAAKFKHQSDVQKWLDIIRGGHMQRAVEHLKTGTRPPFPYPVLSRSVFQHDGYDRSDNYSDQRNYHVPQPPFEP